MNTEAGVAVRTNFALYEVALIYGDEIVKGTRLGIIYDPRPSFRPDHPGLAPDALVGTAWALVGARQEEQLATTFVSARRLALK